jgi:DNA-binding CsgD family transcriptional regulator
MIQALYDSLEQYSSEGMSANVHEIIEWATALSAGQIATQVNRQVNSRLRRAYEDDKALNGALPGATLQAWHMRSQDNTLEDLRKQILRLLEQDGLERQREDRLSPKSLHSLNYTMEEQSFSSSLEDWRARQEVSQELDALIADAGLSPLEFNVIQLTREGLIEQEIAERLNVKVGTVKKAKSRAKEKIRGAR